MFRKKNFFLHYFTYAVMHLSPFASIQTIKGNKICPHELDNVNDQMDCLENRGMSNPRFRHWSKVYELHLIG